MAVTRRAAATALAVLMGITAVARSSAEASGAPAGPQVVSYFPEWGVYNTPTYSVKQVAASRSAHQLTIVNYAFALPMPDSAGNVVCQIGDQWAAYQQPYTAQTSVDGSADAASSALRGHFNQLRQLKRLFPHLKVVVSIGGWSGSTWFSDAAATASSRETFVSSCLRLFVDGDLPRADGAGGPGAAAQIFDGFDLDWEFPVDGGAEGTHHRPTDGSNFVLLLREFRRQFAARGRSDGEADDLLLTIAGPGGDYAAKNFRLDEMEPNLDFIFVMSYDFRGAWDQSTGHHAGLCTSPDDPASDAWRQSLDRSVRLYRDQYRVPAEKIVPGGAFYARGWAGVRSANNGLYQSGAGPAAGRHESGYQYFRDLPVDEQGQATGGFTRHWDAKAKAPWLYNASTGVFWSYDDRESLRLKAEYIRFHRLGGIMTWDLNGDSAAGDLLSEARQSLTTGSSPAADPCRR